MNRTEKLGVAFLSVVAAYLAMLLVGVTAGQLLLPGGWPDWETAARVLVFFVGGLTTAATVVPRLWRGEPAARWLLCAGMLVMSFGFTWCAVLVARPLADPAEQAVWERDYWWVVPLTYALAAGAIAAAGLLMTPQVGAAMHYWKARSAAA